MAITSNKAGVFTLNTIYKKVNAKRISLFNEAGSLWSWGGNNYGILGDNTTISKSSPVQVPGTAWNDIAAGGLHFLARKTNGTLWAWGEGTLLGDNTNIRRSSPIQIPGTAWNDIAAGGSHSLARKTDGTLWAWGANHTVLFNDIPQGQLGDGTTIPKSSPVQIPGTAWNDISAGATHSLARKTDGTLWAWGRNTNGTNYASGALGDNTTTAKSSPIQIPGTAWNDISAGGSHSLARKTDGTLWAWGWNCGGNYGPNSLGDGTTIPKSSPVQIPGTAWNDISAGYGNSLARKTDGTLWAWGINAGGQLGDNTTITKSSPIQIPGTTWNDANVGLARKTDGTLWSWGNNCVGAIGDGTTIPKSSPIQIPGTTWVDLSLYSRCNSLARKS